MSAIAGARLRCHLPPPGTEVSCGVSGGADSLALLVLCVDAGLETTAVHVDHGLRPGSTREAHAVAEVAERLGARFRSLSVTVGEGPDLEARARAARHAALPEGTLLGHTADDRAETVVLALLRGAGPDGLAALDPSRHPLLDLRRTDTEAVCAEAGLAWFEDPTNRDPRFRRNRVRHEVLPLLADVAERDVVPLLCRLAELAARDRMLLGDLAAGVDPTDAAALAAAPSPLASRALRAWLRPHLSDGHPPDAGAVDRVLAVARGEVRAAEVAGGVRVARTRGRLRIEASGPDPGPGPDRDVDPRHDGERPADEG